MTSTCINCSTAIHYDGRRGAYVHDATGRARCDAQGGYITAAPFAAPADR